MARSGLHPLIAGTFCFVLWGIGLPDSASAKLPAHCGADFGPNSEFSLSTKSPEKAFHDHPAVFYGKILVEGKPCSKGFCSGIKVEKTLKGRKLPDITVVTQAVKSDRCPRVELNKGSRWLFFGKLSRTRKGTYYIQLADDAPHFRTPQLADLETLQGRYLLYQAKLDQAVEKVLDKKIWEK